VDTVGLSFGRHQLKFGVDYRRLAPFDIPFTPYMYYYYGFIAGEDDVVTNSALTILSVSAPAYPLYTNFSAFVQDEWKVSQRLSLSLGLRWEVNPAPGVTQGLNPYALQGSGPNTWSLAPQGIPLWKTTLGNFAPRLKLPSTSVW
jgi:outer membrane receptor protein involved in Fe transport